jgi:hypothetical protein
MSAPLQIVTGISPDKLEPPLPPFSEQALAFLHALSEDLLNNADCRVFPNLVALGFWLRPTSLQKMVHDFNYVPSGHEQYAAGLAFHLAPSNVDNLFIYSWAISLLCGNSNVIRLSNRGSDERQLLITLIDQTIKEPRHTDIMQRTAIVSYSHDDDITNTLTVLAARRILWGSNETITHLRSLPTPPLCQDLVFPDRRSVALLSATAVTKAVTLDGLLEAFYRDSYGFDQMACSSPRLVLWFNDGLNDGNLAEARERFWSGLYQLLVTKEPQLDAASLVDKQVAIQSVALTEDVKIHPIPDMRLQVLEINKPNARLEAEHPGGGLFMDGTIDNLNQIHTWLPGYHQTLTYWGIDSDTLTQASNHMHLADRVVPVGQALNFSPVWDGMNLFERLSRLVQIG